MEKPKEILAVSNWKLFSINGVIIVLLVLVPLLITRTDVITWFTFTLLYITLSQSWNIIGGYTGQVNLGHAASGNALEDVILAESLGKALHA